MLSASVPPIDFLAVGHICHDLVPGGRTMGGAAAYGAATAAVLGCRTGILTSGAPADNWQAAFPDVAVCQVPSAATTVFENIYGPNGRTQTIHAVAASLNQAHVPVPWLRAPMVLVGPVANEVDPAIVGSFSNSLVGVAPQGWMRRWDASGRVYQVVWEGAADVLPLAAVTFLSLEDLPDLTALDAYRALSPLLVLTQGERGCVVFLRDEAREFPAPDVSPIDPTGAGDIFAAAYLTRFLQSDGNPWNAAEFANRVAACSVTQRGLAAKMDAIGQLLDEMLRQPLDR